MLLMPWSRDTVHNWSPILQAIKDGMSKASQEISSAQTDQAKAEAQVAAECFEALDKAFAA